MAAWALAALAQFFELEFAIGALRASPQNSAPKTASRVVKGAGQGLSSLLLVRSSYSNLQFLLQQIVSRRYSLFNWDS
jgi:hypothetical protein